MDQPSQPLQPLPNNAELFRTVPQTAEAFGNVPHATETFRTVPNPAERGENHTLTVREVARMFEAAGVARTERSIVNWCQPNRQGIARLSAYFDMNDRRWFITPQSAESAIAEEKAKAAKVEQNISEPEAPTPAQRSESETGTNTPRSHSNPEPDPTQVGSLEKELTDLRILNRGKDYFIEQLKLERDGLLDKLVNDSHRIGELETRLRQLAS
ncbi:hypothetical protein LBMAG56_36060 [Verrucomicrobiota bacterium]|nr:hypothetical protein LBMAG56_36060 [Verrucomicrobiota bacterium]